MRLTPTLKIKTDKNFWSGVMFLCFAAVGLNVPGGYSVGSAGKMGPGYFSMLFAIVRGLLLVVRAH